MKAVVFILMVFAGASASAWDDPQMWLSCDPVQGQTVKILKNKTLVFEAQNGVAVSIPMHKARRTGGATYEIYESVDGNYILKARSINPGLYNAQDRLLSSCNDGNFAGGGGGGDGTWFP